MKELLVRYEKGGELRAYLLDKAAPLMCEAVSKHLPMETVSFHTRWSGRQVAAVPTWKYRPPMENQTLYMGLGDIGYFREWEGLYDRRGIEVFVIGYGPEYTDDERGEAKGNLFARVYPDFWEILQEIGLRIWRHGKEKVWWLVS